MTQLEIILKEQNDYLLEKLEKANRRIGALEYDLRKLREPSPACWKPVRTSDRGAKVWIKEGGDV